MLPDNFAHSKSLGNPFVSHLQRDNETGGGYAEPMQLRIKELRKARGLTVEALAEAAGVSTPYMSQLENGKRNINAVRLEAIAKVLGVRASELLMDGSLSPAVAEHLRVLRELPAEDQLAIFRHALALHREHQEHEE